ncbi:hypothetical protein J3F84DRAFT_135880 [Trichoderma pleuroticola]
MTSKVWGSHPDLYLGFEPPAEVPKKNAELRSRRSCTSKPSHARALYIICVASPGPYNEQGKCSTWIIKSTMHGIQSQKTIQYYRPTVRQPTARRATWGIASRSQHGSCLETKELALTGRSSTSKATASNARRFTPPYFFPQSPSMPWGRDTGGICRSAAARPLLNTRSRLARGALSELVSLRQGRGLELEEVIDGCSVRPRRLGPPRLLYPCLAL